MKAHECSFSFPPVPGLGHGVMFDPATPCKNGCGMTWGDLLAAHPAGPIDLSGFECDFQ